MLHRRFIFTISLLGCLFEPGVVAALQPQDPIEERQRPDNRRLERLPEPIYSTATALGLAARKTTASGLSPRKLGGRRLLVNTTRNIRLPKIGVSRQSPINAVDCQPGGDGRGRVGGKAGDRGRAARIRRPLPNEHCLCTRARAYPSSAKRGVHEHRHRRHRGASGRPRRD